MASPTRLTQGFRVDFSTWQIVGEVGEIESDAVLEERRREVRDPRKLSKLFH